MTADHAAFISAICERPDDDLPRLIYADYLDERGEHERAEFIRCQIELAKWEMIGGESFVHDIGGKRFEYSPGGVNLAALRRRERELLSDGMFLAKLLDETPGHSVCVTGWSTAGGLRYWQRGFLTECCCTWDAWRENAAAILVATPLRTVKLTTWPIWSQSGGTAIIGDVIGWLAGEWPGIEFELPQRPQPTAEDWAAIGGDFATVGDDMRRAMGS